MTTEPVELSIDEAAQALADLKNQPNNPAETAETAETLETKPEEEAQNANEETAEEPNEDPSEEKPEDKPEAIGEEGDEVFEIKVNGEVKEVTLNNLLETYQKSDSAEKRYQEASEIRKAAQTKQLEADNLAQMLSQELQAIREVTSQAQMTDAQLLELREKDPNAYIQYKDSMEQNAIVAKQAEQKELELMNIIKQREHQALLNAVPEWEDTTKFNEDVKTITDYASKFGFQPEEVSSIMDSRLVLLIRDAALGSRTNEEASIVRKKAKTQALPKGAGVPRENTTSRGQAEASLNELTKQLENSGDYRDAAKLLAAQRDFEAKYGTR